MNEIDRLAAEAYYAECRDQEAEFSNPRHPLACAECDGSGIDVGPDGPNPSNTRERTCSQCDGTRRDPCVCEDDDAVIRWPRDWPILKSARMCTRCGGRGEP